MAPIKPKKPVEPKTATRLDDLRPNEQNPRKPWAASQVEAFRQSLVRFGDLGGIVRNLTTNQLIGGHKRIEAFKAAGGHVTIVAERQDQDPQGTVAHGYVLVDGARFGYREVRWDLPTETAANLAANRWAAEWDWQAVAEALQTINSDELRTLTGFADHELANLMAADWTKPETGDLMGAEDDAHDHTVHLSQTQYDLLTQTRAKLDPTGAITDAGAIEMMCRRVLNEAGAVATGKDARART